MITVDVTAVYRTKDAAKMGNPIGWALRKHKDEKAKLDRLNASTERPADYDSLNFSDKARVDNSIRRNARRARKAAGTTLGLLAAIEKARGDRDPSYWNETAHVIDTHLNTHDREIEQLVALYAEHGYTLVGTSSRTLGAKVLTFTKAGS